MKITPHPDANKNQTCNRCGEVLEPSRIVWLELNMLTGKYYAREGQVPADESQGCFAFGRACANQIKER